MFADPRTVLCIGAHADDIEIGCGGTVLRLLERYPNLCIHWLILSAQEPRISEARSSAPRFLDGAHEAHIHIESFEDTLFPAQYEQLKRFFKDLRRRIQPDIVFTHFLNDRHQDHRMVAELTWNTFRDNLIFEYEIPKYEGDLALPNVLIPLEEPTCRSKIEIILESFDSQKTKPWFSAETFWAMLRIRGLEANSPTRLAEAFHARKIVM